jgi:hypothetical protein
MWNKLSMKEKAALIKVAVSNGLTDLDLIKNKYNEFAKGGNLNYSNKHNKFEDGGNTSIIDDAKRKLYRHIYPSGYDKAVPRIAGALLGIDDVLHTDQKEYLATGNNADNQAKYRDDIFATYLGIPENERRSFDGRISLLKSPYAPTINKLGVKGNTYYTFPKENIPWESIISESEGYGMLHIDSNNNSTHLQGRLPLTIGENHTRGNSLYDALGEYTVGKGFDKKGQYVSFYDLWDLAPFGSGDSESKRFTNANKKDQSIIGNPVQLYDRMYLDDFYNIPDNYRGAYYLPEIEITPHQTKVGGVLLNSFALGGPLLNQNNPIESFNGGRRLPVVRYDKGGYLSVL